MEFHPFSGTVPFLRDFVGSRREPLNVRKSHRYCFARANAENPSFIHLSPATSCPPRLLVIGFVMYDVNFDVTPVQPRLLRSHTVRIAEDLVGAQSVVMLTPIVAIQFAFCEPVRVSL